MTVNKSAVFNDQEISYGFESYDNRLFETRVEINLICKQARDNFMQDSKENWH